MLPLPDGASSLESILCTGELRRRPSRPPYHEKENHALVALRSVLAKSGRRRFFARGNRRRIRTASCAVLHKWRGLVSEQSQSGQSGLSLAWIAGVGISNIAQRLYRRE
jgi:hypothetical protein